ncbi:hypothetical protein, partial [Phocaeicola vulgatus]|uniref:hypothetical protein n=1 Tax=Phocaeicola vulgatus TaxID=821 RepID=UPI00210CCF25
YIIRHNLVAMTISNVCLSDGRHSFFPAGRFAIFWREKISAVGVLVFSMANFHATVVSSASDNR